MRVADVVRTVASRFGLQVSRVATSTFATERGQLLAAKGVNLVVDVGANDGGYGRELRSYSGYSGLIVSFEPGSEAYERLALHVRSDTAWEARRVAVSDHAGTASLVVPDTQSSLASLLPARSGIAGVATRDGATYEEVPVETLDGLLLTAVDHATRLHLKVDVQGLEHRVLGGAQQVLHNVVTLECEIALEPMYEGQLGFRDMIDLIDDLGFLPVNMHRNYVEPGMGQAYDADVLFVRRP